MHRQGFPSPLPSYLELSQFLGQYFTLAASKLIGEVMISPHIDPPFTLRN